MAELSITMKPKSGSRKLKAFADKAPGQIKKGLRKAGSMILKDWAKKISGTGFVRNPARASKYPGVMTGQMFRTLTAKPVNSGMAVQIGPNVSYAIFHETGTKHMPARPVVPDVWKDTGDDALDAFQKTIAEPLDR